MPRSQLTHKCGKLFFSKKCSQTGRAVQNSHRFYLNTDRQRVWLLGRTSGLKVRRQEGAQASPGEKHGLLGEMLTQLHGGRVRVQESSQVVRPLLRKTENKSNPFKIQAYNFISITNRVGTYDLIDGTALLQYWTCY